MCSFQKLKLKVLLDEIMKKMAFGKASFAPKVSRTQLKQNRQAEVQWIIHSFVIF